MNERVSSDAMFKMLDEKVESTLETRSDSPSVRMAERVIETLCNDVHVEELFITTDYAIPHEGLQRDLKRIEGDVLVNVATVRYRKNGYDLEKAHRDAATVAFLARQRFLADFIDECDYREQLRTERRAHGKPAPSDGFEKAAAEQAIITHLALTLLEVNTDGIELMPDKYNSRYMFKSEVLGLIVDYGMREPSKLEQVFSDVDSILIAKKRAFVTAVKTAKLVDAEGKMPENINTFIDEHGSEAFSALKKGIRSELFSYELCERVVTNTKSLVVNVPGVSELHVEKSALKQDTFGDVDFVITCIVNGERVTLAGIDVVTEAKAEDDTDATVAFALTAPYARVQRGTSGKYRYVVGDNEPEALHTGEEIADQREDLNADTFNKEVTSRTLGFVGNTGIPVISVRVPTHFLNSHIDGDRAVTTTSRAIANGQFSNSEYKRAVSLSADMLDYSLRAAVKNSMEIKYGN